MRTSHHGRRVPVRLALAAAPVAAFIGLAEAAHVLAVLVGGPRGIVAAVFLLGGVSACGFVFQGRSRRLPELPRSAAVAPEPAAAHEPVKYAA